MRLTEIERAERKMMRTRLEAMSVQRLRLMAKSRGVDLHGATTHLCIINTMMHQYDKLTKKKEV